MTRRKPGLKEELIRLTHRMCFTEQALANEVKLTALHLLNCELLD